MALSHGITIKRATHADASSIATLIKAVFSESAVERYLRPGKDQYPEDVHREALNRTKSRLNTPGIYPFVAFDDETGDVVGFSMWKRIGDSEDAKEWRKDSLFKSK
jgi:hypothetical protein